MSFGAIGVVKTAFGLAKRNFFRVGVLYLAGGLVSALVWAAVGILGISQMQGALIPDLPILFITYLIAQILLSIPLLAAGLGAIALLSSDAAGERMSLKDAAITGLRKTPIAIVVAILLTLLVSAAVLPILGIASAVGPDSPAIVFIVALFIPFQLWLYTGLVSILPALVAEDRGVSAIKRGFTLSSGYRLPIIGALLLFGLAMFAFLMACSFVMALLSGGMMNDPQGMGGAMLAIMLIYIVMTVFALVLNLAFQVAVYARLVKCE